MRWYKTTLTIQTDQKGLYAFTEQINRAIQKWQVVEGMAYLFVQHTSASLVVNENYDASARRDLENFLERLAPEGEPWYQHTLEGKDDSPAHMRAMLTHTSLTIPIDQGQLTLGAWQGVFLAEHRRGRHQRRALLRVLSVE